MGDSTGADTAKRKPKSKPRRAFDAALSRLPDDSVDVTQYGLENCEFPQQTTGDQWYSEAQFESYRRLGYESGCAALGPEDWHPPDARLDPEELFRRLADHYDGWKKGEPHDGH
jgi:hypothetical protein